MVDPLLDIDGSNTVDHHDGVLVDARNLLHECIL